MERLNDLLKKQDVMFDAIVKISKTEKLRQKRKCDPNDFCAKFEDLKLLCSQVKDICAEEELTDPPVGELVNIAVTMLGKLLLHLRRV